MARPMKAGLDYFSLDCVLDDKFELIESEFGLTGFAIVVKLYQKIYKGAGYYCEWDSEVALLFAKRNNVGVNVVSEVVNAAVKRGIFDRDLYESCSILTSKGIQKRYFEAVSRRRKIDVVADYLLADFNTESIKTVNNGINVDINSENDRKKYTKESKVKKSKVKESKGEHLRTKSEGSRSALSPYGSFQNVFLSAEEIAELKKEYPNTYQAKIEHMSSYKEGNGKTYPNDFAKLKEWLSKDENSQPEQNSSYDVSELDKFESLDWMDDEDKVKENFGGDCNGV